MRNSSNWLTSAGCETRMCSNVVEFPESVMLLVVFRDEFVDASVLESLRTFRRFPLLRAPYLLWITTKIVKYLLGFFYSLSPKFNVSWIIKSRYYKKYPSESWGYVKELHVPLISSGSRIAYSGLSDWKQGNMSERLLLEWASPSECPISWTATENNSTSKRKIKDISNVQWWYYTYRDNIVIGTTCLSSCGQNEGEYFLLLPEWKRVQL